jgi:hypothetical protein
MVDVAFFLPMISACHFHLTCSRLAQKVLI